MTSPEKKIEGINWTEKTKAISEAWWNYWNYQGTPDRDFIERWWLEALTQALQEQKDEIVGMMTRKSVKDLFPEIDTSIPNEELTDAIMYKEAYNQALSDITARITSDKSE